MRHTHNWILTDTHTGIYIDHFHLTSQDLDLPIESPWSITKRRLKGGLSDGVDVIEVNNGKLCYTICPTRGMGIWRGDYLGHSLGWKSPVRGPVHPAYVNRDELGGIGWLAGFDEWIVRCGLNNNGAPVLDKLPDNTGAVQSMALPLHGRIANIPAHYVEIVVETQPPYGIAVLGQVDETMLFSPQLRLATEIRTAPQSNQLSIEDCITNLRSQPAELELLYHCNFGPPILGEGTKFLAPIERLAPINSLASATMETWDQFPAPTPGVVEQCYLMRLLADPANGQSLVMLQNSTADLACALRFNRAQLPWFTLWKNPAAHSDGYVIGLEPGTDLPNDKVFERAQGRVAKIPPGGSYDTKLVVEIAHSKEAVRNIAAEIQALQSQGKPRIDQAPPPDLAPSA